VYGNLSGGRGREVYFRARRLKARSLGARPPVLVRLGRSEATLADFSLNGIACYLDPSAETPRVGSVSEVEIVAASRPIFAARAQVVRVEEGLRGTKLALRLLDSLLDTNAAIGATREAEFRRVLDAGVGAYSEIPVAYRSAVFDGVMVLSHWRTILTAREQDLEQFARAPLGERIEELEQLAKGRIRSDWHAVHQRANEALEAIPPSGTAREAARRLTTSLLMPLLIDSPMWRQAYVKPRGYPGDYEFMNMIYEERPAGTSAFSRVMHQIGRDERLASTVRDRKNYLIDQLIGTARRVVGTGRNSVRILSVGAGPAREIHDYLVGHEAASVEYTITLVDQDEGALEYANEQVQRAAIVSGSRVDLRCRYVSFKDLLASPALRDEVSQQDLVYAAGLYDYLPQGLGAVLTRQLFDLLAPHGRLLIGNAASSEGIRWVPEFVLDWQMIYRDREEMLQLAAEIGIRAQADVEQDASSAWHFLVVDRQ